LPLQPTRDDQHAVDVAHGTVQGKLAQEGGAVRRPPAQVREADSHRDGEVEAGSVLAEFCRGQVDGEAAPRKGESRVPNGRANALPGLAHRSAGQPDQEEAGHPGR